MSAADNQEGRVPAPGDELALRLVQKLSCISMRLAADLVQGTDYTFQGHDYLDRNFVCERVMQWRAEWDATFPERNALAEEARAAHQAAPAQPEPDSEKPQNFEISQVSGAGAAPAQPSAAPNAGPNMYRKTALVKAEQFLPAEGKIPHGVYSDGYGDPRKNALCSWVLDTKEGKHYLRGGDYICTGPQGEQWNVEQSIFESTYELAAAPTSDQQAGAGIQSLDTDPMRSHFTCEARVNDACGVTSTLYFTKMGAGGTHQLYRNEAESLWLNLGKALGLAAPAAPQWTLLDNLRRTLTNIRDASKLADVRSLANLGLSFIDAQATPAAIEQAGAQPVAPIVPQGVAKLLHHLREEGVLSEGQITQALGVDRLTCREILDGVPITPLAQPKGNYYVHFNGHSWFVKEAEFFNSQPDGDWKKGWFPIVADSIEDARAKAPAHEAEFREFQRNKAGGAS